MASGLQRRRDPSRGASVWPRWRRCCSARPPRSFRSRRAASTRWPRRRSCTSAPAFGAGDQARARRALGHRPGTRRETALTRADLPRVLLVALLGGFAGPALLVYGLETHRCGPRVALADPRGAAHRPAGGGAVSRVRLAARLVRGHAHHHRRGDAGVSGARAPRGTGPDDGRALRRSRLPRLGARQQHLPQAGRSRSAGRRRRQGALRSLPVARRGLRRRMDHHRRRRRRCDSWPSARSATD